MAVVTAGAGAGIGGAIVRRLHAEGAVVYATDAHAGRVDRLSSDLPGVRASVVDVTDRRALTAHLDDVVADEGHIDVLVNCAGTNIVKPTWELTDVEWDHVFDVNLDAAFRATRTVLPGMLARGSGAIVSIASIAAWDPSPSEIAYSTSKAALVAFTRALAKEVAATGVRVNAVAPSFVENPFLSKVYGPERLEELRAAMPGGRGVLPEEVAATVVWLAGDDASFVTGETVTVAGGGFLRH